MRYTKLQALFGARHVERKDKAKIVYGILDALIASLRNRTFSKKLQECMFVDIEWCRSPTYWTHEMLVEEAQETAKVLWATCTAVCVLRYPKMRQLRYYQRYSELLDILRSAVVFKCAYQMKDFEWLKQELAKIGAKTE